MAGSISYALLNDQWVYCLGDSSRNFFLYYGRGSLGQSELKLSIISEGRAEHSSGTIPLGLLTFPCSSLYSLLSMRFYLTQVLSGVQVPISFEASATGWASSFLYVAQVQFGDRSDNQRSILQIDSGFIKTPCRSSPQSGIQQKQKTR